jgi:hypothetical protein
MRLSKSAALGLAVATLVPLAYMVCFMAFVVLVIMEAPGQPSFDFRILFLCHFAMMIWSWALIAVYVVYLFKTDVVPKDQKVLWAVVLFLGNMIVMPIFWFLYVWKYAGRDGSFGPPESSDAVMERR